MLVQSYLNKAGGEKLFKEELCLKQVGVSNINKFIAFWRNMLSHVCYSAVQRSGLVLSSKEAETKPMNSDEQKWI